MLVIKEILNFAMFLCLFAVLFLFVELQSELREEVATSSFAQAASITVIANQTELVVEKDAKIKMLQAQIAELREIVVVLQTENEAIIDKLDMSEELNDLKDQQIDRLLEELVNKDGKAC